MQSALAKLGTAVTGKHIRQLRGNTSIWTRVCENFPKCSENQYSHVELKGNEPGLEEVGVVSIS